MAATSSPTRRSAGAALPTVLLNFTVIETRVRQILGLPIDATITDQMLADQLHQDPSNISRWRNGRNTPGLDKALDMATALDLPVEQFSVRIKAGE